MARPLLPSIDPRIRCDRETHTYTVQGLEGPWKSVTTLARACGEEWDIESYAAFLSKHRPGQSIPEIVEELRARCEAAKQQGRDFHTLIDEIHNFGRCSMEGEGMRAMHAQWVAWMKKFPEKMLVRTEWMLYSKKFCVAGTVDAIVAVGSQLWLVDWKTNRSIASNTFKEYEIQMQLYEFLLRSNGVHVHRMVLVNVHPTRKKAREIEIKRTRSDDQLRAIMRGRGEALSREEKLLKMYDV